MATFAPKKSDLRKEVLLIDVEGKILGRAATKVADLLRGKGSPLFARHVDTGDTVIVVNAAKIKVTGNKLKDKKYWRFTGYPGGERSETLEKLLARRPEEVIRRAVKGMLPKNKLQVEFLKHLKVYPGAEHPHEAQKPRKVEI